MAQAHGIGERLSRAWHQLTPEQRLAAVAALALLLALLLPWYQESDTIVVDGRPEKVDNSLTAFEVYSFVEAAIFVVVVAVLVLLWARGERRTFHLPGGDGTVIMGAGLWTMLLIFYRQFDRPDRHAPSGASVDVSVSWGIFIAFLLGAGLAYAGYRIRAAHVPEPVEAPPREPAPAAPSSARERPAPGAREERPGSISERPAPSRDTPATAVARRRAPRGPDDPLEGQLSFDEPTEPQPPPPGS